jgi:hypothetical protein
MTAYSSKQDVVARVIIPALTGPASRPEDYDLDGIYADCFAWAEDGSGLVQTVDTAGFWAVVERHALLPEGQPANPHNGDTFPLAQALADLDQAENVSGLLAGLRDLDARERDLLAGLNRPEDRTL